MATGILDLPDVLPIATITVNRYTGPTSTGAYLGNPTGPVEEVTIRAFIKPPLRGWQTARPSGPTQDYPGIPLEGRLVEPIPFPDGVAPGAEGTISWPSGKTGRFIFHENLDDVGSHTVPDLGQRISGTMITTTTYGNIS